MTTGDLITCQSTDAADIVADDYMKRLDESMNYRFRDFPHSRTYLSGLVVEFDQGIEDRIAAVRKLEEILNRRMPRPAAAFKLKGLTLGAGDPVIGQITPSIDLADKADFSLQRRQGEPYSSNRYFSSAPLRTGDHLALLEEIETALK